MDVVKPPRRAGGRGDVHPSTGGDEPGHGAWLPGRPEDRSEIYGVPEAAWFGLTLRRC